MRDACRTTEAKFDVMRPVVDVSVVYVSRCLENFIKYHISSAEVGGAFCLFFD